MAVGSSIPLGRSESRWELAWLECFVAMNTKSRDVDLRAAEIAVILADSSIETE